MIVTRLNSEELKKWNDWLNVSHGIDALPGQIVYQCDLEYALFLTPIRSLVGLCARHNRYDDGLVASFEIAPGVRTIAEVWSDILSVPVGSCTVANRMVREKELSSLATSGHVWWGTESLNDPPLMTSILYVSHETFYFPSDIGDVLKDSLPPPQQIDTELDLA